ncbi:MAG: C4-dicarboxylate ABC transporter substrate-binding protein, partial [Deltaproteobacteria bacterium]|nr:C4-dicarboxylate ABC transporter substrate-binding protein [Deltaproteobacteria bacterium]
VDSFGVKATFVTSARVSEDVVYAITKEVFENFEEFKTLHPAYKNLTKENMLEGLSAPIHSGAMKYYKEAGLK